MGNSSSQSRAPAIADSSAPIAEKCNFSTFASSSFVEIVLVGLGPRKIPE